MKKTKTEYQVVIVGGGAVGLFLGICLHHVGIDCLILEKRKKVRAGSRSLGIHPVSLELFQTLNIVDPFLDEGLIIQKGHAFANNQKLGTLSFSDCPKPFNHILALPQNRTESLLEQHIHKLPAISLQREATVIDINQSKQQVDITFEQQEQKHRVHAQFLVGCDGKDSFVRSQSGIAFEGTAYPDTYIMGDFTDNTNFGNDAAIFLCDEGLIESFPLLNNRRRWVVKTAEYCSSVDSQDIIKRVWERVGHNLADTKHYMLSSFGVQKLVAATMVNHRLILAGDAAHVVSPIGGQGMNLGWLGAWDLAQQLKTIFDTDNTPDDLLKQFEQRRRKAAQTAIRRAEMNMRLGRKVSFPALRNGLVWAMLNTPLSQLMARLFTMRGIERWPI
ncbi:MAG: NAD(P)/FAD-dependent oxidoreductase [Fodinibius sp.]|nr:NAD(P)/FAD-dependent oxidoreductase [Fodinibius sp.]